MVPEFDFVWNPERIRFTGSQKPIAVARQIAFNSPTLEHFLARGGRIGLP